MYWIEILGWFAIASMIITRVVLTLHYLNDAYVYDTRRNNAIVIACILLFGSFVSLFMVFMMTEDEAVERTRKNTINFFKLENYLLNKNNASITLDGKKYKLDPQFRKDLGLLTNKYIKNSLTY